MIELTPWQKKKRKRRMYVELLEVERRVKFDRLKHLAEARAKHRANERVRKKALAKRQMELARLALKRNARPDVSQGHWKTRGSVSVLARWVGFLAAMEPGRWYGWGVMLRGKVNWKRVPLFLDQAVNPKRPVKQLTGRYWEQGKGPRPEPTYLWRLNRWGEALREAVLREPRAERINVLELEGARPDLW